MEVLFTSGRGANTIYTVQEGGRVWTIRGRNSLPPEVFKAWRNKQAKNCMRNSREKEKQRDTNEDTDEPQLAASGTAPVVIQIENSPPVRQVPFVEKQVLQQDKRSSQEAGTSKGSQQDAANSALQKVTCKVCRDKQVEKILIPCGHAIMCGKCTDISISQKPACPWCRIEIQDHMVIKLID